jgi:hypothetical protein
MAFVLRNSIRVARVSRGGTEHSDPTSTYTPPLKVRGSSSTEDLTEQEFNGSVHIRHLCKKNPTEQHES